MARQQVVSPHKSLLQLMAPYEDLYGLRCRLLHQGACVSSILAAYKAGVHGYVGRQKVVLSHHLLPQFMAPKKGRMAHT